MSERLETKCCIKALYKYSSFLFLFYHRFCAMVLSVKNTEVLGSNVSKSIVTTTVLVP